MTEQSIGQSQKAGAMEDSMKDSMRKLAVWYTRTFKPIMTHAELEPIMATLGFVALPPANNGDLVSREYFFPAHRCRSATEAAPSPRPRLPYPRIDGLHIYTYRAFIDAVNFYLERNDISELFHVRGMPLHRVHDRSKRWRRMEDDSLFVYREGTPDEATFNFYQKQGNRNSNSNNNNRHIRSKGKNTPFSCLVPLKDFIAL